MQLSSYDIYVNVAGGLRITEPAMDLGIVAAVVSSFKGKAIPDDMVIFGEVGLVGEVRAVTQCEKRVVEAAKSGFKQCIMPMTNLENIQKSGQLKNSDIKLIGIRNIRELLNHI